MFSICWSDGLGGCWLARDRFGKVPLHVERARKRFTWSSELKLSAFVSGFTYKFATPKDGYLQPYGDYFEMDIDSNGKTVALWGEGNSYVGPGNVWFARQQ